MPKSPHSGGNPLSRRLKRSSRANPREDRNYERKNVRSNIIELDQFSKKFKKSVELIPKNISQEIYIDALENPDIDIVFATGPAGTGKTMLAAVTAIKKLKEGEVEKIVITRPAISVDEQHGFLPGTLIEKMQPWVLPILDYFYEYYSKKDVIAMMEEDIISVSPLAYMRGRTFKKSFIISDECQNMNISQMKMLLTRIGTGSKIVVTGDMAQHDRGYEQNGLKDIIERMGSYYDNRIALCRFDHHDVERHPIIETILKFYE